MSILDKIAENVDYSQNLQKCRFESKFANILILVKIVEQFRFWSIFTKILILVKVYENLGFGQNCRKIFILLNIGEISTLVNIFGKIDLGQNFPQIFSQNFQKYFDSGPNI